MTDRDLNIESLHADFNSGRIEYEAIQLYSYTEDGTTWYGEKQDLMDTFGVKEPALNYGYFFEVKDV